MVFGEGHYIGDSLFLPLIAPHDELQFDTHTRAAPGSSGRCMTQALGPEVLHSPQYRPALMHERGPGMPHGRRGETTVNGLFSLGMTSASRGLNLRGCM